MLLNAPRFSPCRKGAITKFSSLASVICHCSVAARLAQLLLVSPSDDSQSSRSLFYLLAAAAVSWMQQSSRTPKNF
jgi:hypothetical protein